jgi:hypothetical protein
VIQCKSCGASLPDGTAFCGTCGKSVAPAGSGASSDATAAMRQAASRAQSVAAQLGPEKVASIAGGALGLIGTFLPFYTIPSDALLGNTDVGSTSLFSEGGIGICFVVLAIALGAAPFVMAPTRLISLIGFGLAAAALGTLIEKLFGFSILGQSVPIGFGIGYYVAFLGFAILAYGHGRRAYES